MVISPEVLLLLRIVWAILDMCIFHKELRIDLPISVNNCIGILMGIAFNLCIYFSKMAISTMLILPIHEHGRSFHLLRNDSTS